MERQFNREDFERLLRDNANQYRMYPSEKVWKGIYSTLHTRRRWYGLSAVLLLLISVTAVTYTALNNNERSLAGISSTIVATSEILANKNYNIEKAQPRTNEGTFAPDKNTTENHQPVFNPENDLVNTAIAVRNYPLATNNSVLASDKLEPEVSETLTTVSKPEEVIITSHTESDESSIVIMNNDPSIKKIMPAGFELEVPVKEDQETTKKVTSDIQDEISALASQLAPIQVKGKPAKLTAQVYFTPTVSYRKLSENKAYTRAASSLNPNYQYTQYVDVNNVVNHKPAMGLELGIEGRYAITDRIAVKIGGQFNINRYDIRAYFHPTEFATIALNSGSGPDSLMTLSNYRNFNGAAPNWLENFYFTASVPLGADFIIFDNKKIQWGISGSVQPSYVLGDRAYLISKDYKNYAKVKNLMRKVNISTDFETFISYSTGRMRWQVGPQVRYQHLSSFVNEYPVKENLFDIGLKVGASINKR